MSAGRPPRGTPMSSFKVQCPSCEAQVLIKNPNLVGIGLAVAAVALLGIGGYVMFGGDDKPPKSSGGTPVVRNNNPNPNPDGTTNPDDTDKKGEDDPTKKK